MLHPLSPVQGDRWVSAGLWLLALALSVGVWVMVGLALHHLGVAP